MRNARTIIISLALLWLTHGSAFAQDTSDGIAFSETKRQDMTAGVALGGVMRQDTTTGVASGGVMRQDTTEVGRIVMTEAIPATETEVEASDTIQTTAPAPVETKRKSLFARFWHEFNYIDTNYVEPNHYNWAAMVQATSTMEWFTIGDGDLELKLKTDPLIKIGPYLGWRFLFLGYTFAVNDCGPRKISRTEFEVNLYGSMLGCDLIYRSTGEDFKWSTSDPSQGVTEGDYSGGIQLRTIGAHAYYIFNHRRFSHPSLFSQSTVQKRSCGSLMLGLSVTNHEFNTHVDQWPRELQERGRINVQKVDYMDYALSIGYGYNWVIRKNLMLGVSIMPALGYKHVRSNSDVKLEDDPDAFKWVSNNINIDLVFRAALVWNNNTYFAGLSLLFHNYNFKNSSVSIRNTFGSINLYFGLNFIKRKEYRSKK